MTPVSFAKTSESYEVYRWGHFSLLPKGTEMGGPSYRIGPDCAVADSQTDTARTKRLFFIFADVSFVICFLTLKELLENTTDINQCSDTVSTDR